MTMFALVLPVLAYALVWLWIGPRLGATRHGSLPDRMTGPAPLVVAVLALVAGAVVVGYLVSSGGAWRDRSQIAWVGVRAARPDVPLQVGGSPNSSVVLWPNGQSWPEVSVEPAGPAEVRVRVRHGGASVRYMPPDSRTLVQRVLRRAAPAPQPINGVPAGPGPVQAGPFTLAVVDGWFWPSLELSSAGTTVAQLDLPPSGAVRALSGQLQEVVAKLRVKPSDDQASLALGLETWADEVRVASYADGTSVIDAGDRADVNAAWQELVVPRNSRIEVAWPGRTITALVDGGTGQRSRLAFERPWRMTSPVPEVPAGGDLWMTVTSVPRPGDYALELPLGDAFPDPRVAIRLSRRGETIVFGDAPPPPNAEAALPGTQIDVDPSFVAGTTSVLEVDSAQGVEFALATSQDVVHPLAAWFILAVGALVCAALMAGALSSVFPRDRWSRGAFLLCVWQFFLVRFLLSLRFALDPTRLDQTTVRGVSLAAACLVLAPALAALSVWWYRLNFSLASTGPIDGGSLRRRWLEQAVICIAVFLAAAVAWEAALWLWPALPARLRPGARQAAGTAGLLCSVLVVYAIAMARRAGRGEASPWMPPRWAEWLATVTGPSLWHNVATKQHYLAVGMALLVLEVAAWFSLFGAQKALDVIGGAKLVQELVSPFVLVLVPVVLLLGSAHIRTRDRHVSRKKVAGRLFGLGVVFVCIPVISPALFGDLGGIMATLALLLPTSLLLLTLPDARTGLVATGWLAAIIAVAMLGGRFAGGTLPDKVVELTQRGISRVLVFRLGDDAQSVLPLAQMSPKVGNGIPVRSLQNAIEHTWENRALARTGGWLGTGFASAPVERSMVPGHVAQFDSTFSFYLQSESGVLGSTSLLLLYLMPFAAVVASARRRFDVGHAVALVVAASCVNESLIHAGMNLGALPFTGRNLPMLSVNSLTDALRWIVLWAIAAQALCWRDTGRESFEASSGRSLFGAEPTLPESGRRVRLAVAATSVPSVLLATLVISAGLRVAADDGLLSPFGWRGLTDAVNRLIDDKRLTLDAQGRISMNLGIREEGDTFIEQEVVRFNSLPEDERLPMPSALAAGLGSIQTLAAYDAWLDAQRLTAARPRPARHETVFEVLANEGATPSDPTTARRLRASPGFGNRLSFDNPPTAAAITTVTFAPSGTGVPLALTGPAWVNGRWRTTANADGDLPWMGGLLNALPRVARIAGDGGKPTALTLNETLQRSANAFVAEQGRRRHAALLAGRGAKSDLFEALPPRVALSIVQIPTGNVLAMGGWPRTSSGNQWQGAPDGWRPPAAWLASAAPAPLRVRYEGDRNFDALVMGSATKPLWATAALEVHPDLANRLRVRGSGSEERDVFGLDIGTPWDVHPAPGWVDLTHYLATSDNRFHIRLGFLGLALAGDPIESNGASPSVNESMDGGRTAWRRYPAFSSDLGFSRDRPRIMSRLDRTELAHQLRDIFGPAVVSGERDTRRHSFWTGRETDDFPMGAYADTALDAVSPQTAQLQLDAITNPRDFVSQLLGGQRNRWSNLEFAAAFGTAVTGHPVLSHVLATVPATPGNWRRAVPGTAAVVRPGLAAVLSRTQGGTAASAASNAGLAAAFGRGYRMYAKTGTLATDQASALDTSRLALAIVQWDDERAGTVKNGAVLSLVIERGQVGMAAQWLTKFAADNAASIKAAMAEGPVNKE